MNDDYKLGKFKGQKELVDSGIFPICSLKVYFDNELYIFFDCSYSVTTKKRRLDICVLAANPEFCLAPQLGVLFSVWF